MKRLIVLILMMSVLVVGCNKEKPVEKEPEILEVYGGDIVRYSIVVEEGVNWISLPIVSNKKINEFSIRSVKFSNPDKAPKVEIDRFGESSITKKYNGYYIYFAIIQMESDSVVDTSVESIEFLVDGETVKYETPYLKVKSEKYYEVEEGLKIEDRNLLFTGDITMISGIFPDENRMLDLRLTCLEDVKLESYSFSDYVDIKNMTCNGAETDSNNMGYDLKADENINMLYNVTFEEHVTIDNIIRAARIIRYTKGDDKYVWISSINGLYIWDHQESEVLIERYIDKLQQ